MKKVLYILLGSLSLLLGVVGIIVPGLPTTTFLLISAFFYVRSSEKLYNWLLNHKIMGKYIREYRKNKAITKGSKIYSLTIMWVMILLSGIVFIDNLYIRLILLACGIAGTILILRVPTLRT